MNRYIDANKIKFERATVRTKYGYAELTISYYSSIAKIPTADVRENVRGEWINLMGHQVCSICGYKNDIVPTNYCPNCGAQMCQGGDAE